MKIKEKFETEEELRKRFPDKSDRLIFLEMVSRNGWKLMDKQMKEWMNEYYERFGMDYEDILLWLSWNWNLEIVGLCNDVEYGHIKKNENKSKVVRSEQELRDELENLRHDELDADNERLKWYYEGQIMAIKFALNEVE